MTLLNYTDPIPLPAPVTSGTTIQSYTDPLGDIWVAKNGVYGGNWMRARNVLICKVWRSAAWTATATSTNIAFDSVHTDNYGMYASPYITVPIAGIYRIGISVAVNATAAGQWLSTNAVISGSAYLGANNQSGQTTSNTLQATASDIVRFGAAGQQMSVTVATITSLNGYTGPQSTSFSAAYQGPL